jgi:hypothetical protein
MASHDNPTIHADDATIEQIMSAFGTESAETGADLVIQDLDQCSAVTPAWTYCG